MSRPADRIIGDVWPVVVIGDALPIPLFPTRTFVLATGNTFHKQSLELEEQQMLEADDLHVPQVPCWLGCFVELFLVVFGRGGKGAAESLPIPRDNFHRPLDYVPLSRRLM